MKRVCFLLFTISLLSYGQITVTEFQSWFDFNGSYKFNELWKTYGDVGYRTIFINKNFHRFYVRPSASFQLNSILILHGGFGAFSTFDKETTLWEFRPFQGLQIKYPKFLSIQLNHYFRFEERFFSGNTLNTFIFRARYRLSTSIQIVHNIYFPLQFEWFVNYGKDIDFQLNEFRCVLGFGYIVDSSWKLEFNTIFQNTSASSDLFSFNDIIFRFRVYKEIGFIK
ncbi:MAG: DUF2490 domain-containing protein [Ignavibacteria bacterium]|nr:DUF2490 domain-containing protein [Ignavibacteria bacterium]